MYLKELLSESFDKETAVSAFKNVVSSYISSLQKAYDILTQKIMDGDPKSGKRLAGLTKAKWVSDRYMGMTGMEAAARELQQYYNQGSIADSLRNLSRIKISAFTGSGKSERFDEIGDLLLDIGMNIPERSIQHTISNIQFLRNKIKDAIANAKQSPSQPSSQPKQKDTLSGQQNAQAEQMFSQVLSGLPKDIRHRIRSETARMSPTEKMAYLRRNLGQ